MRPACQYLPDEPAHDAAAAALVILTHCNAARERFAAADEQWTQLRVYEVALLTNPTALAREIAAARGVLIHLHNGHDHRDGVLRLAALLAARHVALAVVRDDDVADDVLDAISNLPPSTVRRLRALIGNNGVNAANATLTQFALAVGLSSFPSPLPTESRR